MTETLVMLGVLVVSLWLIFGGSGAIVRRYQRRHWERDDGTIKHDGRIN